MTALNISRNEQPETAGSPVVDDFSLLQGGPIYRFQVMIRMAMPDRPQVLKRAFLAVLFTWLPLLILAAIQGQSLSGVTVPFLRDYATDIRYLIALPVLIAAETTIDPKLRHAVKHFITSGLVDVRGARAFEEEILKTNRLRDSWLPTVVLILLAFVPSFLFKGEEMIANISSWHRVQTPSGEILSLAGWWFALLSVPIYRLLMYRWVWIIVMWSIFLGRMMRLPLNCVATHPDRAAGLGFLVETQRNFGLIAFAASAVIAGGFGNQVAYQGKAVADLKFLMIGAVLLILAVTLAPLLMLAPKLYEIKRRALFDYGALGTTYVRDFDSKWIKGGVSGPENLLGTGDIQSLADLSNSFDVVRETKYILIDKEILIGLGLPILLPIVVFLLAASPADEVVHAILKLPG